MSKTYFNPGCALSIYKPDTEAKLLKIINDNYGTAEMHKICCRHEPQVESGSLIINVCAGCDRRFRSLYEGVSTVSLWEVLDGLESFKFPDHSGLTVSIHDACPIREKPQVHAAVRNLLRKMNIKVVETEFHGTQSVCCGDDFYPNLPVEKILEKMKERAVSMPCNDVCVYCVSCVKSMHIGGKNPRYLVDLLMNEPTDPQETDTVKWHATLDEYIERH